MYRADRNGKENRPYPNDGEMWFSAEQAIERSKLMKWFFLNFSYRHQGIILSQVDVWSFLQCLWISKFSGDLSLLRTHFPLVLLICLPSTAFSFWNCANNTSLWQTVRSFPCFIWFNEGLLDAEFPSTCCDLVLKLCERSEAELQSCACSVPRDEVVTDDNGSETVQADASKLLP